MMAQFHFLRPLWLLALPAVLGLTWWLARRRGGDGDWTRLIDADLLQQLRLADGDTRIPSSPWPWLALAWSLATLALAGPSWERDQGQAWHAPAAWVLLLDLSPSMAQTDLAPDRVSRARFAIEDLLAAAGDNRVALVVFSDEAYVVTPLTDDVATVRALLAPLAPDIMPSPGDHLAPALDQAAHLLQQAGYRNAQVVVLSDGNDDATESFAAAGRLRQRGARVQVVGILPASGAKNLDEDRLRQLAASGGGTFVELAHLPTLIGELRQQRWRGGARVAGSEVEHWRDGGIWLLPPLLLATLLARRGWS